MVTSGLVCTVNGNGYGCWYDNSNSSNTRIVIRVTDNLGSTTVNTIINGFINP